MQKKKNFKVSKPSALLKKERDLKELQEAKVHVKGKIVKIKKHIKRFQDQLEDSRSAHEAKRNLKEGMIQASKEVIDALNGLKAKVRLSKKDGREINLIVEALAIEQIMETKEEDEEKDGEEIDFRKYTDEFNRKKTEQIFDEYMVKPSSAEQQNMRKIFLHLAGRFHPDKANGEEQTSQFHEMMQQINAAYDAGDLEKLLALQVQYAQYTTIDSYSSTNDIPLADVIQEQILRTRQEVEMLESQLKRLKKEKLNLENSELGQFIQYYKDETQGMTEKQRRDFSKYQELMLKIFGEFKQILIDWSTVQKRPKAFNVFISGEHPLQKEMERLDVKFNHEPVLTEEEMLEDIELMMQGMSKKQRQEIELVLAMMMAAQVEEEEKQSRRNKKKR